MGVFQNQKRLPGMKKAILKRYTRTVGLGFKMPAEAREGNYIDKKCPFTGKVSIRGRILTGVITKMKMNRLSLFVEITCITSRNTIVSKNAIRICPFICHLALGTSVLVMLLPLVNAVLCLRPSSSTHSKFPELLDQRNSRNSKPLC